MKKTFFECDDNQRAAFLRLRPDEVFDAVAEPLTEKNVEKYADAEVISCFIYSDLSAKILSRFKQLKMIATRSSGYDHIDLDYCRAHNIRVANVPSYGEKTVAEHVFALLLGLSRHIPEAARRTKDSDFTLGGLEGFDLDGKTIGIVGTGAIGMHVAQIAAGFGMKLLGYDTMPKENAAASLGMRYTGLKELLQTSDIITLHVPGGVATSHLLSDDEFALMKTGVVIINTGRGSLINHKALLLALKSGKVRAAGLDVLPEEPTIREEAELLSASFVQRHTLEALAIDHALASQKNVIVTPHSAFYTREAVEKILLTTCDNIDSFINGKPQNIVSRG